MFGKLKQIQLRTIICIKKPTYIAIYHQFLDFVIVM
jgi:hypothetical protein